MKKIKSIILSYDTFISLITTMIAMVVLPKEISNELCVSIYGTAITILSIIFSIFFASLAVIMAFPDNEFIAFMEVPDKLFSRVLGYFKITLGALFIALIYTIVVYIITAFANEIQTFNNALFIVFVFLFTYSLFATAIAIDVTLKLTSRRANYLANIYESKEDDEEENQPTK